MESSEKKSFILYHDYYDYISKLSLEERGELITAIFEYQINGAVATNISPLTNMVFAFIEAQFERDNAKYQKICERNRKNGEKGGRPKKNEETQENPKNPMGYLKTQENPDKTQENPDKTQENPKNPIYDTGNMIYDTGNMIYDNESSNEDIKEEIKENTKRKNEETRYADRFARFWSAYPKKVGKGDAEKRFLKLKPSEELTEQMIRAVEAQKNTPQWVRDGGQYIPHPSTWLNQERWRDELPRSPYDTTEEEREAEYQRAFKALGIT